MNSDASQIKLGLIYERIILAISSETELNNSNNLSWPCSICNKNVLSNQIGIQCDSCDKWSHAKCNDLSPERYEYLATTDDSCQWHCLYCTLKFHHKNIPFILLDNSEIEKINNSDSMKFCESLPSFETVLETNRLLPDADFEHNIPSLINSKYYSVNSFQKLNKHSNLNIFHSNVNGLENKFDNLHEFLVGASTPLDIVALTETSHKNDDFFKSNVTLAGYSPFYTPTNTSKGGTALYVNSDYNPFERYDLKVQCDQYESVWIEISNKSSKNILCGCVYRHPNQDLSDFLVYLESVLKTVSNEDKEVYICGDFNVDLLKLDDINSYLTYYNLLCSYSFLPLIIHPSRKVDNQTPSLIDNIFSNNISDKIASENIYFTLSEHFSQFASVKREKPDIKKVVIFERDFSKYNAIDFRDDVSIQNWNMSHSDSNVLLGDFYLKLKGCADRHAPIKKLNAKEVLLRSKPWIYPDLAKMIHIKNNLFGRKKRQPTNLDIKILYNKFRNRVNRELKKAKKSHYTEYFNEHSNNVRKTWQGIRSLVNVKNNLNQGLSQLKINGKLLDEPKDVANHINEFFVNVGPSLEESIPKINHISADKYLKNRNQANFIIAHISNEEVLTLLQSLPNKGTGPVSIPLRMLKEIADLIVIPLCHIINISFTSGVFPDMLKIAKVLPLHKGGSTLDPNNFRPISLLSIFDNIIEKLLHKQLYEFLEFHNILFEKQFGFRRNNSTVHALMEITEKIKESIDGGKFGCGIFIDLKKAFDTVNHKILLTKLEHYGVRGVALEWFASYLTGRKQFVSFNGESSDLKEISCGVPQGSVLGPLLFLLYINDLPNVSEKLNFFLFADDTNIYYESNDLQNLEKVVNNELKHLSLWLKVNRLSLNINKTNFVIFHSNQRRLHHNVTLKLDRKAICQKDYIKYLGVFVDCHLSWKHHISIISKKVSRSIGIMYRIRKYVDLRVLKNIYYSLIYSHIVYAIQVWGSANVTELDKILILQKKAVRMMTQKDQFPQMRGPLNPSDPIFVELGILKVQDVFKLQVSKFIYECLSFKSPRIFWDWFIPNHSVHSYNTTSNTNIKVNNRFEFKVESISESNILHTQCSKLANYGAKQLKVAGPFLWNSFPAHIRNANSIFTFKSSLKKFFIEQYNTDLSVSGHYYVSKMSICGMKLTISKMHTFYIPPYLPSRLKVSNISNDGMKILIYMS